MDVSDLFLIMKLRKDMNATQVQMARCLSIPYRTYQDWENGVEPAASGLALLAKEATSRDLPRRLKKIMEESK